MKEYDLDTRAGVLIFSGHDLRIQYMDPALVSSLGNPACVEDLLPESMHEKHRKLVGRYVGVNGEKQLPDSLNHPLRNVPVVQKDQSIIQSKLIIGRFEDGLFDLYYVVMQPSESHKNPMLRSLSSSSSFSTTSFRSTKRDVAPEDASLTIDSPDQQHASHIAGPDAHAHGHLDLAHGDSERPPSDEDDAMSQSCQTVSSATDEFLGMVEVYGLGAVAYIERGLVPAAERYAQATVLYMDIVDFTRHCMARHLDEIGAWMARIHSAVDALLSRHAVRKVETRGDCVICVAGTNFAPAGAGATPLPRADLAADQATRMLAFGRDLGLALAAIDGTAARMGMATGPVVLTHIAHCGDALPAKYIYGDTVNVACRMEQTGRVGAVQLAESAARALAEERGATPPPLVARDVKGKGVMRAALFDCATGRFLDPAEVAQAPASPAAKPLGFFRRRRASLGVGA
jgi:class 3 adenylate cyclase